MRCQGDFLTLFAPGAQRLTVGIGFAAQRAARKRERIGETSQRLIRHLVAHNKEFVVPVRYGHNGHLLRHRSRRPYIRSRHLAQIHSGRAIFDFPLFYFQVAATADKRDALLASKGNISTSIFYFYLDEILTY